MVYFKINNHDYSMYVSGLKVAREHIYKGRTNASGNTRVQLVNTKRIIEVAIIPLDAQAMANLQADIDAFTVSVSFLDPKTAELAENVNCMIPQHAVDYYTIQANNVKFKAFTIQLKEL